MSKKEGKRYICVHMDNGCLFEATKRKSIMTHLLRTHNERKEEFECEYCDSLFHDESEIDKHLFDEHAGLPFRYTCVSRIENVINKCAKLGEARKPGALTNAGNMLVPVKTEGMSNTLQDSPSDGHAQNWDSDASSSSSGRKHGSKRSKSETRKLAVNESLNNIAKLPKIAVPENPYIAIKREVLVDSDNNVDDAEQASGEFISQPSGLKIKLNLKNIALASTGDTFTGRDLTSRSAYETYNSLEDRPVHSLDEPMSPRAFEDGIVIREHGSKYFDREEVYHTIDALGRRCCPFCDYTTTKNTIRVHLSGIHKVYFVQCSLCDYKAAFPHQVTQHGHRFHKIKDIQVNQLSKEFRERIISELSKVGPSEIPQPVAPTKIPVAQQRSSPRTSIHEAMCDSDYVIDDMSDQDFEALLDDDGIVSRSPSGGKKTFKAPKCQTSKTDYYSIQYEDGVYLYSCKLCTFKTPVRATIYTHKYRHEEKSYKCGHCDYTSHPRSNVAHHIRTKHKGQEIIVLELADSPGKDDSHVTTDVNASESKYLESLEGGLTDRSPVSDTSPSAGKTSATYALHHAVQGKPVVNIKQEPIEPSDADIDQHLLTLSAMSPSDHGRVSSVDHTQPHRPAETVNQKTIIKVPQYKPVFSPNSNNIHSRSHPSAVRKAFQHGSGGPTEYKMSLNKMYRINPRASPRYMCNDCSYACDTHPKMKHHLYSHRPQRFQCPYCDHRKYPRSYVLRHVRDTHRGKPIHVIDIGVDAVAELDAIKQGEDNKQSGDYDSDAVGDDKDDAMDYDGDSFTDDLEESMRKYIEQDLSRLTDEPQTGTSSTTDHCTIKMEHVDEAGNGDTDSQPELKKHHAANATPRAAGSPSRLRAALTANTSVKTSALHNSKVKPSEKKKSLRDYRINSDESPRYVCNVCGYGTDIYKTIHNHMYRHESQRFQCPYCGYRRSPRSFVENHIREVHRGQPVVVTELASDTNTEQPQGSPRQCNLKRKDPSDGPSRPSPPEKKPCADPAQNGAASKLSIKWPAPKPASKVNMTSHPGGSAASSKHSPSPPRLSPAKPIISVPTLQIPMKQKTSGSSTSPGIPSLHVPTRPSSTMPNLTGLLIQTSTQSHGTHTPQQSPSSRISPKVSPTSLPPAKQLPQIINNLHQRQAALLSSKNASGTSVNKKSASNTCTQRSPPPPPPLVNPNYKEYHEGSRTTFKTMYKCVFDPETCNHISKDKSKMKQHLFMHVEYKPWTCDLCDVTGSQSSHVKHHIRIEHPGADISYKYKRHNYLEKHIESFLTKGLFTVPVNEYRMIMDMKVGHNKKQNQPTFRRDHEGFILCPHCDYKTKSGGMTDHVKMKHFQPRFKCHWCDYKAFYRSEVRKHHRKERSHVDLEFKTQELDLSEVMDGIREGELPRYVPVGQDDQEGVGTQGTDADSDPMRDVCADETAGMEFESEENSKDSYDDDEDDVSSEDSNNIDNSAHAYAHDTDVSYGSSNIENSDHKPMDTNLMSGFSIKIEEFNQMRERIVEQKLQGNAHINDRSMDSCDVDTRDGMTLKRSGKEKITGNFQCGYCTFSAKLRMKVKMHCQKRHSDKDMSIIDQVSTRQFAKPNTDDAPNTTEHSNIINVDYFLGKGTKFEQDLKKAGVTTLNLDSLFPKTTINLNRNNEQCLKKIFKCNSTSNVATKDKANDESTISTDIQIYEHKLNDDSLFKKPSCIQIKDKAGRHKPNEQTDLKGKCEAESVSNNLKTSETVNNDTCANTVEVGAPLSNATLVCKGDIEDLDTPLVNDNEHSVSAFEVTLNRDDNGEDDMEERVQTRYVECNDTEETQLIVKNNETGTTIKLDIQQQSSSDTCKSDSMEQYDNEIIDSDSAEKDENVTKTAILDSEMCTASCDITDDDTSRAEVHAADKSYMTDAITRECEYKEHLNVDMLAHECSSEIDGTVPSIKLLDDTSDGIKIDNDPLPGSNKASSVSENDNAECVDDTHDIHDISTGDSNQEAVDVEMGDNSNGMEITEKQDKPDNMSGITDDTRTVVIEADMENYKAAVVSNEEIDATDSEESNEEYMTTHVSKTSGHTITCQANASAKNNISPNIDTCDDMSDNGSAITHTIVDRLISDQPNDVCDEVTTIGVAEESNSCSDQWNADAGPPDIVISPLNIQDVDTERLNTCESDFEHSQDETAMDVNDCEHLEPPALSPAIQFGKDIENVLTDDIMDAGNCGDIGIVTHNDMYTDDHGDSVSIPSDVITDHSENHVCNGEQIKLSSFYPVNVETA